jgi:DNA-binding beta-propeller fold protein YncE
MSESSRRPTRDDAIAAYREAALRDAPDAELARLAAILDPETVKLLQLFRMARRKAEPAAPAEFVARLERILASLPPPGARAEPTMAPLRLTRSHAVNGRRPEPAPPPFPHSATARPRLNVALFAIATVMALALLVGVFASLSWRPRQQEMSIAAPPAAGRLELVWASTGGPEPLVHPSAVGIDPTGNVWIADGKNDRFQILGPDGAFIETWGTSGSEDGQFEFHADSGNPMYDYGDVAFAADGTFYVADTGNVRVQQFAPDRSFIRAWGSQGNQPGQFVTPVGIAVGPDGSVYVSDEDRSDIQKFSPDGRLLAQIGLYGGQEPGHLRAPGGVAVDADGDVWVADTFNNRVQRFRADGSFVSAVGRKGAGKGEFNNPYDVAVDAQGRVYVADMGNDEMQVLSSDGRFLTSTGRDAPINTLSYPLGVAVAPDGAIYAVDSQRVRAFRLALALGGE